MEFAIVAPLLFLLVFGIIEFGRLMMVQQVLTNAAREGSRHAILPGASSGSVQTRVQDVLNGAGIEGYTIAIDPGDPSSASADDPVSVTVNVPYANVSWVTGFLPLGDRILTASSVMRKEPTDF